LHTDPFLFRGIKSVTLNDPHQRILLQLAQNNIAVYCPHTALDAADGGINDWIADQVNSLDKDSKRSVIQPIPQPEGYRSASVGYGRRVDFSSPVRFEDILTEMAKGLGALAYAVVARPKKPVSQIKSMGICAGSGSGVLKDCDADLLFTGEMTHHDALRATMMGQTVVTVFHSNSERRFLKDRLAPALVDQLGSEDAVLVSEKDADPYQIWDTSV
jgi:dinuclear metal center YbgI/SA1388 family protein